MRTGAFGVLAVAVLVFGGEATGQGPGGYQNSIKWAPYSPWGMGNQVECTVQTNNVPDANVTELDYRIAAGLNGNLQYPDMQHVSYYPPAHSHTFSPKPDGPLQIRVTGTWTYFGDPPAHPAETRSVSSQM